MAEPADQSFPTDEDDVSGVGTTARMVDTRGVVRDADELIAAVAHELRTPLSAVLGWASLLRASSSLEPEVVARGLEAIERNARTQARLVEDLLDLARIRQGKLVLWPTVVDAKRLVLQALDSVGPTASARGIGLELQSPGRPCHVRVDADRLRQVLSNLLWNAVKFTPTGGRVTVELFELDEVVLHVRDTGVGIAPDVLPHVFDRFMQADPTADTRHKGLGLGLAIVRHIVEAHGGMVQADSGGLGRGSTFTVRLPRVDEAEVVPWRVDEREATGRHPIASHADALARIDVLVVDPDLGVRDVLAAILGNEGADVRVAASADEAMAMAERKAPDVLVCALELGADDACEFVTQLRRRQPGVCALALGSSSADDELRQAIAAGFLRRLVKPIDACSLVEAVVSVAPARDDEA